MSLRLPEPGSFEHLLRPVRVEVALRAVDQALSAEAKKYAGRDGLVCVHGNRFIEWAALRALGMTPPQSFASIAASVPAVVEVTVAKLVTAVKSDFPDSYPASLFKNLSKCKVLAAKA